MKINSRDQDATAISKLDRRSFLKLTGVVGTGLILGVTVGCSPDQEPFPRPTVPADVFAPNALIRIDSEGIFIYAPNPEVGQGVKTSLPMIIAEELDVAWEDVTVIQADVRRDWYGRQMAEGSRSIPMAWKPLRQAGAVGRHMLIAAAAARWEVEPEECETRDSQVFHTASGRVASYMELAREAADRQVPDLDDVELKHPSEFRLLGKRITGVDNLGLVSGQALFGIDQVLPGMVYATYIKCPATRGEVQDSNLPEVRNLSGVLEAFSVKGNGRADELLSGIAIVAADTWTAFNARKSLSVVWDESAAAKDNSASTRSRALELAGLEGDQVIIDKGDVDSAFEGVTKPIESFYEYGFLSHAQLEPQNATAWWHEGVMDLWVSTQAPHRARKAVSRVLDIPIEKVVVHQLRGGGGFGRGHRSSVSVEVAAIAHRLDVPVKLTWMREDDMAHDFYRAGGFHSLRGAIDDKGQVSAWKNHFISLTADGEKPVSAGRIHASIDPSPFISNYRITQTLLPWSSPCGPWRAPESNVIAFAHQSFLHELAVASGRDHVEFLLSMMGEPRWLKEGDRRALHTARAAAVIKLAADQAGWNKAMPEGHALGLAFYFSHAGHVAEIAEVSVSNDRQVDVHRVTVAADVGPIINLSGAENQVEGSVIDGFSAMLGQEITFENGRAQQTNFHEYPILRITRAPEVDVHFVDSDFPPSGLGEPALPPLAPAVANAIFMATGERVRRLPISREGWS